MVDFRVAAFVYKAICVPACEIQGQGDGIERATSIMKSFVKTGERN